MFRISNFDRTLDNATSHLLLDPDWPAILLICDSIRQNDVAPKHAFSSIKKRMNSPNPHTALYALIVLESVVKNCGSPIHDELCTKENCEMFSNFIETTAHENVKAKLLELIQTWAFAFRSYDKYQAMKDTVTILKTKGHKFPKLKEADAMFTSATAPDWSDGKVCHRCRVTFSFTQRRHHCRNCGQIFCAQCSGKLSRLPKFGIEREVRVCDGCFSTLQTPSAASRTAPATGSNNDSELPAEYLSSSLAQQPQSPPRKTDQELKEEEELELALALSQSEAEQQKNKQTPSYRTFHKSPTPEPTQTAQQPTTLSLDESHTDPELAKYLNRDYWEQRKTAESPASPSAPSPMSQSSSIAPLKNGPDEIEIDDFANNLKTQVEIFVNRMKSNSSRGRSIANDSSVQSLFMNMTSSHSRLLAYIKEMDDKRMWFEQLQDKLTQVKDSRAALDVLRQEYQEKLRRQAEEAERQRQLQMAYKLEVMRKKKQEYLQYQRQLALQRLQEQERELQMRQEQQIAYHLSGQQQQNYSFMPVIPGVQQPQQGSPIHQAPNDGPGGYTTYKNYNNPQSMAGNVMPTQRMGSVNISMSGVQPQMLPLGVFNTAPNMAIPPQQQSQPPMPGMMNLTPQHLSPQQQHQPLNLSKLPIPPGQNTLPPGHYINAPPGQQLGPNSNLDPAIGTIPPPGAINTTSTTNQSMIGNTGTQLPTSVIHQQSMPTQQLHSTVHMMTGHPQHIPSVSVTASMPPVLNQQNMPAITMNPNPSIQYTQAPAQNQLQSIATSSATQHQQSPIQIPASPQQQQSPAPPLPAAPIQETNKDSIENEVSTAELISFD